MSSQWSIMWWIQWSRLLCWVHIFTESQFQHISPANDRGRNTDGGNKKKNNKSQKKNTICKSSRGHWKMIVVKKKNLCCTEKRWTWGDDDGEGVWVRWSADSTPSLCSAVSNRRQQQLWSEVGRCFLFPLAPPCVNVQVVHDVDTFMTEAGTPYTAKHTLSSNKQQR